MSCSVTLRDRMWRLKSWGDKVSHFIKQFLKKDHLIWSSRCSKEKFVCRLYLTFSGTKIKCDIISDWPFLLWQDVWAAQASDRWPFGSFAGQHLEKNHVTFGESVTVPLAFLRSAILPLVILPRAIFHFLILRFEIRVWGRCKRDSRRRWRCTPYRRWRGQLDDENRNHKMTSQIR